MKVIILVGVPGSGKSSVLRETIRAAPFAHVVNYGDKMLEEAAQSGLSRDQLRKLPFLEQQGIGIRAAKKIVQDRQEMVIVDTHALIRTDAGFCPGLPKEVLHILAPKALVWIECDPALILERRKKDATRRRDDESEGQLALHQEMIRSYLAACSMETGAFLCALSNSGASIEHNCQPLVRLLKQLASSSTR